MPFLPSAAFPVDLLPDGDVEPLAPVVWTGTRGDTVTIGAGRRSDLGTVPKLLRGVLPHDGKAARAFLVHDELCERLHEHQRALTAWQRQEDANDAAERRGRGLVTLQGPRPTPPPFDAVDTDAVLRVILAELGVGPVRWIYWEGVRAGALGSRARRRGFLLPRSVVPFVLLAVPTVVAVLPAAIGALVSRALLGLFALACWPWEARARAKRAAAVAEVRREAARGDAARTAVTFPPDLVLTGTLRTSLGGRVINLAGPESSESATRTEVPGLRPGPYRRCALAERPCFDDCPAALGTSRLCGRFAEPDPSRDETPGGPE